MPCNCKDNAELHPVDTKSSIVFFLELVTYSFDLVPVSDDILLFLQHPLKLQDFILVLAFLPRNTSFNERWNCTWMFPLLKYGNYALQIAIFIFCFLCVSSICWEVRQSMMKDCNHPIVIRRNLLCICYLLCIVANETFTDSS